MYTCRSRSRASIETNFTGVDYLASIHDSSKHPLVKPHYEKVVTLKSGTCTVDGRCPAPFCSVILDVYRGFTVVYNMFIYVANNIAIGCRENLLRSSFMSCILPSPCNPPNLEEYIQHKSCHYAKTKTVFTFSLFHQHPHFYSMRFDKISVVFLQVIRTKNNPITWAKANTSHVRWLGSSTTCQACRFRHCWGPQWTGSDGDPQEGVGSFRVLHVCKWTCFVTIIIIIMIIMWKTDVLQVNSSGIISKWTCLLYRKVASSYFPMLLFLLASKMNAWSDLKHSQPQIGGLSTNPDKNRYVLSCSNTYTIYRYSYMYRYKILYMCRNHIWCIFPTFHVFFFCIFLKLRKWYSYCISPRPLHILRSGQMTTHLFGDFGRWTGYNMGLFASQIQGRFISSGYFPGNSDTNILWNQPAFPQQKRNWPISFKVYKRI